MDNYQYETVDSWNDYELQEKYIIERNGQRIVVSYRIKHGEEISKSYLARGNAIKAFMRAWSENKMVMA